MRIVDLGANIGLFSLRCIELRNRHHPDQPLDVIAVEGVPRVFRQLTQNLPHNGTNLSLSLYQGLIGQRHGVAYIYDNSYAGANAVVPTNGKTSILPFRGAHAVRSTYVDLQGILPLNVPIDLLKCDIEGAESAFLRNYSQLLVRTKVIAIELHPLHCDVEDCRRLLALSGFEREKILKEGPTLIMEMHVNGRERYDGSK